MRFLHAQIILVTPLFGSDRKETVFDSGHKHGKSGPVRPLLRFCRVNGFVAWGFHWSALLFRSGSQTRANRTPPACYDAKYRMAVVETIGRFT